MCTLGHFLAAGKCKSSQGLTLLTVRLYSDLILKALKESVVLKPKYSKLFIKKKNIFRLKVLEKTRAMSNIEDVDVDNISEEELYKLALSYFKDNEGKSFHIAYQEKLHLVALTQQASQGNIESASLPALGTFDIIGKERRSAWEALGNISKEEAKERFSSKLLHLCPGFKDHIIIASKEKEQLQKSDETKLKEQQQLEIKAKKRDEEKLIEEAQRRAIQDALNQQTFQQFKSYAEQQYPGNVDQQAVLIKQLQEQHYYQYMHQLYQKQQCSGERDVSDTIEMSASNIENNSIESNFSLEEETSLMEKKESKFTIEAPLAQLNLNHGEEEADPEEAQMWTRKDINEFKDSIRSEENESIIKIGHGETVTVRVPTHVDGKSIFWEFATDSYDIGFGVFFEWVEPEDTQVYIEFYYLIALVIVFKVTVHISDSEDEDEEDISDEDTGEPGDAEVGGRSQLASDPGPPTSCIVPIYRRDCHEEVYAGSHHYPRKGIYLLKFDNSYSLWRSKNLYYRVYYTR